MKAMAFAFGMLKPKSDIETVRQFILTDLEEGIKKLPVEWDSTNKSGMAGMKMPLRYVCEMVCDRVAASRIYLGDRYTDASPWEYYDRSKGHYMLHPETRALLEKLLKMVRDLGQERTFAYMKFLLGCQTDY